jgi:ribonuclease Z
MELVFLGTGSMVPTKERNVTAHLIEYRGEYILVDCGEGTQRQMNLAGYPRTKVKKVLLTHWHGDHVAGLIGLIQTVSAVPEPGTLTIFGPVGTKQYMHHLLRSLAFDLRITLDVQEIDPPVAGIITFWAGEEYELQAARMDHGIPCLGYSFVEKDARRMELKTCEEFGVKPGPLMGKLQRGETVEVNGKQVRPDDVSYLKKGKKLTFILDTQLNENCIPLAKHSDILVCESTYKEDMAEKGVDHKHLTTKDACQIAANADVEKLIITHFSQRYKTTHEMLDEAKNYFPNVDAAFDFMKVKL